MKAKFLNSLLITILVGLILVVPTSAKQDAAPIKLFGQVLDPLGEGVANQWVTLTSEDGANLLSVQTASNGSYSIADLPAGNYFIRVSNTLFSRNVPPRYWLATHNPVNLDKTTSLDIPLQFTLMTVEVKEPNLNPLPGVEIFTSRPYNTELTLGEFPAHGKSQYIEGEPAVTDIQGVSLLWLFPTQSGQAYDVTAKPDSTAGYGAKIVRAVTLTETKTLTIIMDPPQNLSGIVSFPVGTPLANQIVSVIPQPPETASYPSATTRPSGSFVFSVAPASYNLRVEKNGYSADTPPNYWISTTDYPLAIQPEQSYYTSLVLPFEEVNLTIRDELGNPVPNAAVTTSQPTNNSLSLDGYLAAGASQYTAAYPAYSDTSGNVSLRLFPTTGSSTYTLTVTPPPGSTAGPITLPGIQVPNTQPVQVILTSGATGGGDNQAPTADAGPDQTVDCSKSKSQVLLDGSESFDPDGDALSYSWSGGFLSEPVSGMQPAADCPEAGSYTVTLTVTDPLGASGSGTVIIDVTDRPGEGNNKNNLGQNAGDLASFVGGGGWFRSPEGAYTADPAADGKLTFGFVVRYKKGETTPSGNTILRLHGSDFALWAYNFELLTIDGNLAVFQGTGADKEGNTYGLRVTSYDGWDPGDDKGNDLIRIMVWDLSTGEVVYDNEASTPDGAQPTTILEGGSIAIHKSD